MATNANTVPFVNEYGYSISWGLGSNIYTIGGAQVLPQSSDDELGYDTAQIRDGFGITRAYVFYDPHDSATIEFAVINNTASYDGYTASMSYPTQGTMVSLSGPPDGDPISGSNWLVNGVTLRRTNTDCTKIQLKVTRYGGITQ